MMIHGDSGFGSFDIGTSLVVLLFLLVRPRVLIFENDISLTSFLKPGMTS